MEITNLLASAQGRPDADVLSEILSNRIDCHAGEAIGACVSVRAFDQLTADLIKWRNLTSGQVLASSPEQP